MHSFGQSDEFEPDQKSQTGIGFRLRRIFSNGTRRSGDFSPTRGFCESRDTGSRRCAHAQAISAAIDRGGIVGLRVLSGLAVAEATCSITRLATQGRE